MICPLCEAEIEEGSIYCNHCGRPIQVVPDYNALDDDLPAMLSAAKKQPSKKEATSETVEKKIEPKVIALQCIVLAVVIFVLTVFTVYNHSYSFYYKEANAYFADEDFENAVIYYEKALHKSKNFNAYIELGKSYYKLKDFENAENAFLNALEMETDSVEAVTLLAKLYDKTENSEKLAALFEMTLTDEQLKALEGYASFGPSFSVLSGKFESDVAVELFSEEGYTIYYTLDGTAPSEHNGKLYEEPVKIRNQGKTTLSAVCVNEEGKVSDVVSETYEISYVMPANPELSLAGGKITKETYLTITCETEGVSIYYTWDDSMPTVESAMYTEPILIPEGNNILSVIAIDAHGMNSDVVKSNYIYYP